MTNILNDKRCKSKILSNTKTRQSILLHNDYGQNWDGELERKLLQPSNRRGYYEVKGQTFPLPATAVQSKGQT